MTSNGKPQTALGREEARALYELHFETALDAMLIVDGQGRIVLANATCGRLFGAPARELTGRLVEEFVPSQFSRHAEQREAYLADPAPRPMGRGHELFVRAAGGEDVPVDISLSPFMFAGRRFVSCTLRDLHGRSFGPDSLRVQSTALRAAANGIVITDAEGVIAWVNPAACAITGYDADELVGQHTRLLRSGVHDDSFYAELWRTVSRGETWSGTIVNRRKDGGLYSEEQTIAPVQDEQGRITHYIAIKQDVSERLRTEAALAAAHAELGAAHRELAAAHAEVEARLQEIEQLNRKLAEQVVRDPLTGLYNRRYLEETIARDLARANRTGEPVTVAALDVDHFKAVNDTYGHAVGDEVLRSLAQVLRDCVRASDLVCRIGGEEFVVVLPGASLAIAEERAEQWRRYFAAAAVSSPDGRRVSCTVSVGLARLFMARETFAGCLQRADEALYAAKRAGRDRVMVAPEPPELPEP